MPHLPQSPSPFLSTGSATGSADLQQGPKPLSAMPSPPPVALSTSWAPDGCPDVEAYLDQLQRIGAQALVVVASDAIPADLPLLNQALGRRRHELPVIAVEGIVGALALGTPHAWQTRLCSTDRDEAQTAVAVVRGAMDLAVQLGAQSVIASLGSIGDRGDGIERLFNTLQARFRRGVLLYEDEAAGELRAIRGALASRHLDAAMRSLDPLLEQASRCGLQLVLRNPPRGIELPAALELATLRGVFSGAPLSSLLDLPAAHAASMLHLLPLRDTVLGFAGAAAATDASTDAPGGSLRPLANLADACGAIAGLVPGQGEANPARVARALPAHAQRLFVPWAQLGEKEVQRGLASVAAL